MGCSASKSGDVVDPASKPIKERKVKPQKEKDVAVDSEDEGAEFGTDDYDSDLEAEKSLEYQPRREPMAMAWGKVTEETKGEKSMAIKPWKGAIVAPAEGAAGDEAVLDSAELEMEWVYGFRGHDTRSNLKWTADGRLVYFSAAVGIVLDVDGHSQSFFKGHTDDIISMGVAPNKRLVATGEIGKTPKIIVWDATTMETVVTISGDHKRGVSEIAFDSTGSRIASVGLDNDHTVIVYDAKTGKKLAEALGGGDKIFDLAWSTESPDTFATCGTKHIRFWSLDGSSLSYKRGLFGRKGKIETLLSVEYYNEWVISGTTNGNIYVWKGRNLEVVFAKPHAGSIYAIEIDGANIWTGGKDGKLKKWEWAEDEAKTLKTWDIADTLGSKFSIQSIAADGDTIVVGSRNGSIMAIGDDKMTVHAQGHGRGELWGLATHPSAAKAATTSQDGTLILWDLTARLPIRSVNLTYNGDSVGGKSVAWSPDGAHIAVGTTSGAWLVYSAEDLSMIDSGKGRKSDINDIKYSPDGTMMAAGSRDNKIDIYMVSPTDYKKAATLSGHSSYITHIDWSADSKWLQSNCGAYELLFWNMETFEQETSASTLADAEWASQTCVLGWSVQGVFPKGSDGTDVNAVDRSHSGSLLAVADDFGQLKVTAHPCLDVDSRRAAYLGHSAHVTNARWTFDDSILLSTGGGDGATIQWRIKS